MSLLTSLQATQVLRWNVDEIASKNVEVKRKAIYSSVNLIMHCLLQIILTRWRWSNIMMMRSDKRNKNFYSTVKYNLTWLREKLLTLSLLKTKSEKSLSVDVKMMIHCLHDMMHWNLKMTWDWVHHAIVLLFEAMLAFASILDENTTHVSYHCAQTMNTATASDHLISMIYHALALFETRRDK